MPTQALEKPIYIYFHVCLIGEWREIVGAILATISSSGLSSITTGLRVGVLGSVTEKAELARYLENFPHEILFHSTEINECERPTLERIASDAKTESFHALYLHSKGVTKPRNTEIFDCVRDWTNYLLYWLVEQHGLCIVKLLEGFRAVGCRQERSHRFSGHFWWASSEHLQNCVIPGESYQDQEYFLGLESPEEKNFCCIHSPPNDHFFYKERFPRERYAGDFQPPFEFYGRGIRITPASKQPNHRTEEHLNAIGLKYNLKQAGLQRDTTTGGGDKSSIGHNYLNFYEELLQRYPSTSDLLEIGVKRGESLFMWSERFNQGTVTGVDIDLSLFHQHQSSLERLAGQTTRCHVNAIQADATQAAIQDLLPTSFDIILDDGSHRFTDIVRSFELLFPNRLNEGGTYIVEDVHYNLPGFANIVDYFTRLTNGAWGIAHNNPWRNKIRSIVLHKDIIVVTKNNRVAV